jgi:hypothetical protein
MTFSPCFSKSAKENIVIKLMQMPLFDENDGSLKEHKTGQMFL